MWFHVDAAWGGAAILSPALKQNLAGIEQADSITFDAHKWLSVPMGCGMFFCRHRESVRAFHADVTYGSGKQSGPVFDPLTHSMQWSRRFIGLKLFLALANLGESGYAAMIEHQARLGYVLRQALTASGWQIVNETPLPLVCFTREHLDSAAFLAALHRRQIAWMSEARIDGSPVLRACITNFRTTETDIHQIVDEMNHLFGQGVGAPQAGSRGCDEDNRARRPDNCRAEALANVGASMKRETIVIHAGYEPDAAARSVAVPIYQTVAYAFDSAEHAAALFNLEAEGYRYTRISNPTTAVLERRMAALEGGLEAMCVASGQAAVSYAVLNLAGMGRNIVSPPQLYGTTHTLFAHLLRGQGVSVRFAESDGPEAIEPPGSTPRRGHLLRERRQSGRQHLRYRGGWPNWRTGTAFHSWWITPWPRRSAAARPFEYGRRYRGALAHRSYGRSMGQRSAASSLIVATFRGRSTPRAFPCSASPITPTTA